MPSVRSAWVRYSGFSVICVCPSSDPWQGKVAPIDAQGFAKFRDVATVMVAAYTALMTGVISLFSLWKNQAAAKELEQLKRSLQVDLLTEQLARNLELENQQIETGSERLRLFEPV